MEINGRSEAYSLLVNFSNVKNVINGLIVSVKCRSYIGLLRYRFQSVICSLCDLVLCIRNVFVINLTIES